MMIYMPTMLTLTETETKTLAAGGSDAAELLEAKKEEARRVSRETQDDCQVISAGACVYAVSPDIA